MRPTTLALIAAAFLAGAIPASASAQRLVAFDTVSESTPAALSCGFCGGEKFGMIFRELSGGGGLLASEFPLTINSLRIAVASANVTGDGFTTPLSCVGSSETGTVGVTLEVYAGVTAPTGAILANPKDGPWAGETMVFAESVDLERSIETTPGSRMYNVMANTVNIDGGAMVAAPNTYVRIVATIPSGGSSTSCSTLSLPSPGAVGIRDDDGRIENNIGFIYALNPLGGLIGIPEGWHWNESPDITDPISGAAGIGGDWFIRMDVAPPTTPPRDAGVGTDSGTPADSGAGDSGTPPMGDGGVILPDCVMDSECAGGEVCEAGSCVRVSCAAASDCGGGMTCVEGRCRGLCDVNADCAGGEVCDMTTGVCETVGTPPGTTDDGGCGCATAKPATSRADTLLGLAALSGLFGLATLRRRRRRR